MPTSSHRNLRLSLRAIFPLIFFALQVMEAVAFAQDRIASSAGKAISTLTSNPVPTLSNISPSSATVGSAGFTLTLSGSNFLPTSVVRWNGSSRPVTFDSSFQLRAAISALDIQLLGNNTVTVSNPGPGGGLSSPATFTVYLGLTTNDLIYDARRGLLWASVPSSAGASLGNSVVSIDPYTGVLGGHLWVGSEPGKLSLSTDGSTLWVAFRGTPSVRKINLNTMVATPVQLYFPGGWGSNIYATGLAASPGSTSAVAVAAGFVTIYDNATARPNTGSTGATSLAFGATPSTLYGYSSGLSIFTVDSTGIISTKTPNSGSYSNDLRYDKGRLYLTSGQVLDGVTGNLLGTFAASGPVAPDSKLGRAFVLNSSQSFGTPDQVTAFDVNTFIPLGSFGVGGLQTSFDSPTSFVRWGADGVAFRTDSGVYVLRSSVVHDLSATPADISVSSSAPASSATGANTSLKFTVKNLGPNTVSHVSLLGTFSAAPILASASASQGTCAVDQVVRCDLGQMTSDGSGTVSVTVIPTLAGTLKSTAVVSSALPDPKISNNKASSVTSVTGPAYNPTPVLSSISPQSAPTGGPPLTLTLTGSNFSAGSTVNWNGAPLPTTFVDGTHLSATVDASLMGTVNSAQISVTNATPGGGMSGALPFSIFRTVALDTNDIAFDPFTRKLYASVPSTAPQVKGNSIVSIDPVTGKLGTPVFVGSEPTRMSISDDGQYLYVVLSGSNSVRRMSLTTLTAGTQFTTVSPLFGAFSASDVAVMPGNRNVVATLGYSDGIQVWDVTNTGATARPLTRALVNDVYEGSVLAWGNATSLYSNDEGLSPSTLHRFTVGPTSFAETDATYLDAVGGKITYSGGRIFSDGGGVVDPSPAPPDTPHLVGRLTGGGSSAVDTSTNGAFFLDQNSYNVSSRVISAFDPTHFVMVGSVQLDNLTGDAFDLIRWGRDGLGFRTTKDFWGNGSGRVVLLRGSFVLPPSSAPNPVPSISALFPASVVSPGSNTWITISGSNFVPGSIALWSGSARTTVFVNSGQLRVAIPAADLVTPRTANLRVNNPAPGGGNSVALTFTVK
jgi:trimeric autotransporter adhesin